MSELRRFNSECADRGIPPEERFELFAQEWPKLIQGMRMNSQILSGPLHEGYAISRLFRQLWAVFGFAVAPVGDLRAALQPVFDLKKDWKWVEPYAGIGYIAMQI